MTLIEHAALCVFAVTNDVVLTTDIEGFGIAGAKLIQRPAELAQDDTPMIAVVQHALEQMPGNPDDIIVLLQPTQPFRTPDHIRKAIKLLRETQADSVVSVVPLPLTHSPEFILRIESMGELKPCNPDFGCDLMDLPTQRQAVEPAYIRDGTVYAFWRRTVTRWNSIYGSLSWPLILEPHETCELDTEEQWADVERRWKERKR